MYRFASCLALAAVTMAQETFDNFVMEVEDMDVDRYQGGIGTADNTAKFTIISPELVELDKATINDSKGSGIDPTLWIEFYYKNNAETDVREFHGNMYLVTNAAFEKQDSCTYTASWTAAEDGSELSDAWQV